MYVNIETKEVITREELESRFSDPIVGFPIDVSNEVLKEFGYANLEYNERPESNEFKQIDVGPIVENLGHYYQTWIIKKVDLDKAKASAISKLNSDFSSAMASLQSGWPDYEVKTWDIQAEEAKRWSEAPEDNKPSTPFLTQLSTQRAALGWDEPFEDLVSRIVSNTYNYTMATAAFIAIRHVAERDINSSEDPSELTWKFEL